MMTTNCSTWDLFVGLFNAHLLHVEASVAMSGRRRNQLPTNLPQLQNLIKRDPVSYKEEVEMLE